VRGLEQEAIETLENLPSELVRGQTRGEAYLLELEAIATEARHLRCPLKVPEAQNIWERLIWRSLWQLLHEDDVTVSAAQTQSIDRLVAVGEQLKLDLSLHRVQELYFAWLQGQVGHWCLSSEPSSSPPQIFHLLNLGHRFQIDVSPWLD
jgi:hypothetical protein